MICHGIYYFGEAPSLISRSVQNNRIPRALPLVALHRPIDVKTLGSQTHDLPKIPAGQSVDWTVDGARMF